MGSRVEADAEENMSQSTSGESLRTTLLECQHDEKQIPSQLLASSVLISHPSIL